MDWIPAKNADYVIWLANLEAVIAVDFALYGLTAGDANDLNAANAAVQAAFTLAQDPATRTPVTVNNFDVARAAATVYAREFNATAQALPATSGELITAGFPVRSTVRSPQTPITASIDLALVSLIPEVLRLTATNPATPNTKAKPLDTRAVQFAMTIGTTAGVDPAQATEYRFGTRVPYDITTTTLQRGKIATIWARYQSRGSIGGQLVYGPYSLPLVVSLP